MIKSSIVLLVLVLGVCLSGVLACSNSTFCVSEKQECPEQYCCGKCHKLQWYVNNTSEIVSDSILLFLSGDHVLLNATFKIVGLSNVIIKGILQGKTNKSSV